MYDTAVERLPLKTAPDDSSNALVSFVSAVTAVVVVVIIIIIIYRRYSYYFRTSGVPTRDALCVPKSPVRRIVQQCDNTRVDGRPLKCTLSRSNTTAKTIVNALFLFQVRVHSRTARRQICMRLTLYLVCTRPTVRQGVGSATPPSPTAYRRLT